jgi:hypothetical protein
LAKKYTPNSFSRSDEKPLRVWGVGYHLLIGFSLQLNDFARGRGTRLKTKIDSKTYAAKVAQRGTPKKVFVNKDQIQVPARLKNATQISGCLTTTMSKRTSTAHVATKRPFNKVFTFLLLSICFASSYLDDYLNDTIGYHFRQ